MSSAIWRLFCLDLSVVTPISVMGRLPVHLANICVGHDPVCFVYGTCWRFDTNFHNGGHMFFCENSV